MTEVKIEAETTELKNSKLLGKGMDMVESLKDQLVGKGRDAQTLIAFKKEGSMRIEGDTENGKRLFLEVRGKKVEYGLMQDPQISFVSQLGKDGKLSEPDVMLSPTMIRKLSGELGGEIKEAHKEAARYLAEARKLQKGMKGEYREGNMEKNVFTQQEGAAVFVKENKLGKITEFGLKKWEFSFVPSKEGGLENPAVFVKHDSIEKLNDLEAGVVVGMLYKNITTTYAKQVQEFLAELERLSKCSDVEEFRKKHTFQSVLRLG